MSGEELFELFRSQKAVKRLARELRPSATLELTALSGSAFALALAAAAIEKGGIHLVVMDDRDEAAYLCNDLYNFLDADRVLFFPTAYKRSIQFGQEDPQGIMQRTAALNEVKNFAQGYLVICTYPEALVEKVVAMQELKQSTLNIKIGDKLSIGFVEETLKTYQFERVDFVYEPGQYSVRGGIVDVFSFSDNRPYRLDFFGDEIESIRYFDLTSQLSVEKLDAVEIVPNLKEAASTENRVSFSAFITAGGRDNQKHTICWLRDPDYALKRFDAIRTKVMAELDEPSRIDTMVTSRKAFLADTQDETMVVLVDNLPERPAGVSIDFETAPQPQFNKQFELLAANIQTAGDNGYTTYILTDNRAQIERLANIFRSVGEKQVEFGAVSVTLHAGFVSHALKAAFYTDHQIFDRYHRYRLKKELDRSEALTIQELNALKVGDYVVHIDHGVGRFGGLVRSVENGKVHEAIKLVYRDGDVLLVNVHALHRISRYKDRDSEPPKINKLGSGAWQRLKQATKKAVKDIARELIALYAQRKASQGFAFSPDGYMQHELEASFIYEDTPDQATATAAIKADMESPRPMDRLVCGDVGFGKTELAIRAAFKAVTDGKQVAVLIPTTILSLQHYRTFNERLRDFPVRIEQLSRSKTGKELKQILADLEAGKIDILIGTHKILGKEVKFKDLGLLIIDEEQKFGVASKEKLRHMKANVDTLTLTATPIPRTLQFSLMGSRDLSVITTPPPNRQPIATESHLFDEEIIKEAIEYEVGRGGQVYFVHNRVEDIRQIQGMIQRLCPNVKVAVGHGQMKSDELEKVIMDFIFGEYDVLLATTIIESGVDIPNANTIIINNAQNFGLSDLHQLRGRVGRANRKAFCYLLSPPDEMLSSEARRRLRALEEFSDLGSGFNIAMQDLDIRGAGNLLGAEQSGFIADIGFETYQKILNEAMAELREEQASASDVSASGGVGAGPVAGTGESGDAKSALNALPEDTVYISDCQIDTDAEALLPDEYVGDTSEKIRLYRELDGLTRDDQFERFAAALTDRFGTLPPQAVELIHAVQLRQLCIRLGFEKVIAKNGILILQFVLNQKSAYYRSAVFMAILRIGTQPNAKFVFKQGNNKLSLVVKEIKDLGAAVDALRELEKLIHNTKLAV